MNPITRHRKLLENKKVARWYENLKARSQVTSDTYLRNFGLWLEYLNHDPESIIIFAKDHFEDFKGSVSDNIRELEKKGTMGASISTSLKALLSYLKYNNVSVTLGINIKNENRNLKAEKEVIPNSEDLSKILRMATLRERVSISLMSFSGLRPEVLGNIDGTDGLNIGDIPDLKIEKGEITFENMPVQINVRPDLSKIRVGYFTFLGNEGAEYLKEYLRHRLVSGEKLRKDTPIILPVEKQSLDKKNRFLMTTLLLRRIKATIIKAGYEWRPYIFRIYFGTNLDTAEAKGLISHPWRQFIMGHKGDIEETYTKREGKIDEGREQYSKCLPYIETQVRGMREEDKQSLEKTLTATVLQKIFGYTPEESEKLMQLSDEELQKELQKKLGNAQDPESIRRKAMQDAKEIGKRKNRQVMIPISFVDEYFSMGFEFVSAIGQDKAIMRLP